MGADAGRGSTIGRRLPYLGVAVGIVVLLAGIASLVTEVTLLRVFDGSELSGVDCGAPEDRRVPSCTHVSDHRAR